MNIWDILIFSGIAFVVINVALRISGKKTNRNLHNPNEFKETKRLRDEMMNGYRKW